MLDALVATYPACHAGAWLAAQTDYKMTGGIFGSYLGTLTRAGYVRATAGILPSTDAGLTLFGDRAGAADNRGAARG
jgi:hypothetical protein